MAAVRSWEARHAGVDYTLKRYGQHWFSEDTIEEGQALMNEAATFIKSQVAFAYKEMYANSSKLEKVQLTPGLIAAQAALVRLSASFNAALLLIRNGFHNEASAVSRLILEQIAWAYAVRGAINEKALEISPTKAVTLLKAFYPDCGMMYGSLSEESHFTPDSSDYRLYDEDGIVTDVILRSSRRSLLRAVDLLFLTDLYVCVCALLYDRVEADEDRATLKGARDYANRINELRDLYT